MPDALPVCSGAANLIHGFEPLWVFVDLETFWSQDYSIRKLDPPSYILDPRFEAIMMGVAYGNRDPFILHGDDIPGFLDELATHPNVIMVSHNALFDMAILSWRYDYRPRVIVDTVSIARTLLGHIYRHVDLATLATHYGLAKGDAVQKSKGLTGAEIIATGLWSELAGYCLNDVRVCRTIAMDLIPKLPPEELVLQDIVARCAVDPALKLDTGLLAQHHGEILLEREKVLAHAMRHGLVCKEQLMSNPQFAELLQSRGVIPPMKISEKTNENTFAFAKKDPQFLALQDHEDPGVQALIEARLTFKSTGEETRTARMLNIATLDFPFHGGTNTMPIPLVVGAAHTHRLGGGWQLNAQNWGRQSPIRKAIVAPKGYKIVAADSAQIEPRMNAWFCGQTDLLEEFRSGVDFYASFASEIYGFRVNKESHPRERRIGKTGIIQLGYQSGAVKFKDTLWVDTFNDPDGAVDISDDEAQRVVSTYRAKFLNISGMWRWMQNTWLPLLAGMPVRIGDNPRATAAEWKCVTVRKGVIEGPTGLCLYYDNLREEDGEWWFDYGGSRKKLYGGKLLENTIQFLARLAVMSAAVRLKRPLEQYTSRLTHSSHDEIVYIVPNEHVSVVSEMIELEMTRPPEWAKELPLACEIGIAANYGDAK